MPKGKRNGNKPKETGQGKIVALGYDSSVGAFINRLYIAKDVWGSDDPAVIRNKIGPG